MACGEIGLTIEQYYNLTQRQFYNILKGYNKKRETELKNSWEQTRLMAYYAVQWSKKMPTLNEFMPFLWDSEKPIKKLKPTMTQAQMKAFYKSKKQQK